MTIGYRNSLTYLRLWPCLPKWIRRLQCTGGWHYRATFGALCCARSDPRMIQKLTMLTPGASFRARNFSRFCYWLASLRINASDAGVACRRRAKCAVLAFSSKFFFFVYVVNNSRMEPLANNFIVALKDSSFQPLLPNFLKCVWNNCHHYPAFQSFLLLGGVAQWLGRQPLPGGISLIFAWTMVNT